MIRCTIEMIPHGVEERARKIGMIEIANEGSGDSEIGDYVVVIKKSEPFRGALKDVWKRGKFTDVCGIDVLRGRVSGFDRKKRGVYDLLYRALGVCLKSR